jgi:hypothetical protein
VTKVADVKKSTCKPHYVFNFYLKWYFLLFFKLLAMMRAHVKKVVPVMGCDLFLIKTICQYFLNEFPIISA